jgi:hypothetical protein
MSDSTHAGKSMTREGLKEILRVNFQLYKDDPDFFEYITTLVIYLMEYEYQREGGEVDRGGTNVSARTASRKIPTIPTRYKVREGCCPHCNNVVPQNHDICPYCMAMIEH